MIEITISGPPDTIPIIDKIIERLRGFDLSLFISKKITNESAEIMISIQKDNEAIQDPFEKSQTFRVFVGEELIKIAEKAGVVIESRKTEEKSEECESGFF